MRYLVRARLIPGREQALLDAIEAGTLGEGSVAEGEYLRNMREARWIDEPGGPDGGAVRWVEVCYCATPLEEERPYWEEFFELVKVQDAHLRANCRDENGTEPWACGDCDCTEKLESRLRERGDGFLDRLKTRGPRITSRE
jgi:hypothetical protein